MNENINKTASAQENDVNLISIDELESQLENELDEQLSKLKFLESEREKIGNPESLGDVVKNVIWEQFVNQIVATAGEDFIKENNGLKLDLSHDAHFQTTGNFEKGNIASHNTEIDYQQRYNDWQSNFQKDQDGNVLTHSTRSGKEVQTLVSGARDRFDKDRPSGSKEKNTAMDHTVPAAEIIRDSAANAHLSKKEQESFANSSKNLYEMDARLNASKGDKSTSEWLDNPNARGQKPREVFDICKEEENKMRKKDKQARKEYEKRKQEGIERSIKAGKVSRRKEAFRIGSKALRAVVMQLLSDLVKEIIDKLVKWFQNKQKSFNTFIESVKSAVKSFIGKLKEYLVDATKTLVSTIVTAIMGPLVRTLQKAWSFIKQGWKSLLDSIHYLNDPENRNEPFSIKVLQVGKIIMTGLSAAGAIVLSDVIEKGLMTIPAFAIEIPLLGSLASIIGLFMGALVAGIIGAIVLNLLDGATAKARRDLSIEKQLDTGNEILKTQRKLRDVTIEITDKKIEKSISSITERHKETGKLIRDLVSEIIEDKQNKKIDFDELDSSLDSLLD